MRNGIEGLKGVNHCWEKDKQTHSQNVENQAYRNGVQETTSGKVHGTLSAARGEKKNLVHNLLGVHHVRGS